jgi:PKHD-type hydroxylase
MLISIPSVIDPQQLAVIQQAISQAPFVDGKSSAGKAAQRVKHNQEVDQQSEMGQQLAKIIIGNLTHNPIFQSAALPNRVATPFIARYTPGMNYGDHIDDPIMGQEQRFRCDVACTVFLNNPDDYDGGELNIRTAFGTQQVKLNAGDAVVYPASSLHHVADVTRGERIVAVTWIQSLIRDPARRELLHELNLAREKLLDEKPGAEVTEQVDHSYTNLVRMWSEV